MGRCTAMDAPIVAWSRGVLYFLFVLPRWWELMGDTSHTLGTVLRIVTGVVIALAALPVLLTLIRTRKPELGDPAVGAADAAMVDDPARHRRSADRGDGGRGDLAQPGHRRAVALRRLRRGRRARPSGDAGVLSGVRRRAAAEAGQGEEATQEARQENRRGHRRGLGRGDDRQRRRVDELRGDADESEETEAAEETADDETPAEVSAETPAEAEAESEAEPEAGALRNKRPSGKTSHRLRRRNRGGVALDD